MFILGSERAIVKTLTNESPSVRQARADYFRRAGFPPDGGDAQRWVVLRVRSVPFFAFPNTKTRRRSVKLHDIHHVLTGYDTSWTGESEIGAWEIGPGCGRHWVTAFRQVLSGSTSVARSKETPSGIFSTPRSTIQSITRTYCANPPPAGSKPAVIPTFL